MVPMLRFLLQTAFVFLFIIAGTWYWVAIHPMAILSHDYPSWKAKGDMLKNCEVGTLATIGDSTGAYAVDPRLIGPATVNFNLPGGKTPEMLILSRRLLACKTPPKAVLLIGSFPLFEQGDCCFWQDTVRFDVFALSFNDIDEFRKKARKLDDPAFFGPLGSLFDLDARISTLLNVIKFPSYYFPSVLQSRFIRRLHKNELSYERVLASRGQLFTPDNPGNWEILYSDWKYYHRPSAYQLSLLDDVIALYQIHNVPLYYVASPYKESDMIEFSPTVRAEYESFLADYEKRYPNFHIIGGLFPTLPNTDFQDAAHVNVKGAEAYSNYLQRLLTENHIEH